MTPTGKVFQDRREAGRRLAELLPEFFPDDALVILALPQGGVPVAAEIATSLGKPFDILAVRKLGGPGYEEVAMGANASGGVRVLGESRTGGCGHPPGIGRTRPPGKDLPL